MNYPKLNEIPTTRDLLDKFKGYNHNLRIGEGEFYDMKNLTGDDYPILSPRKKRGTAFTTTLPNGMCSNTSFCYVDGQDFHMVGEDGEDHYYDMMLNNSPKELISMGSNVLVMPDRKYINTVKPEDRQSLTEGIYDVPAATEGETKPKLVLTVAFRASSSKYDLSTFETAINRSKKRKMIISPSTYDYYKDSPPQEIFESDATNSMGMDTSNLLVIDRQDLWYTPSMRVRSRNLNSEGKFDYVIFEKKILTPFKKGEAGYSTTDAFAYAVYSKGGVIQCGYVGSSFDVDEQWYIFIYSLDDDKEYFDAVLDQLSGKTIKTISGINGLTITGNYGGVASVATLQDYESTDDPEGITRRGLVLKFEKDRLPIMQFGSEARLYEPMVITTPISIETAEVKETSMPDMDYVIESENRLWGCKYGLNNNGEWVNEIYSSRLGDFKDWAEESPLTSMSPYVINVGTSGKFTGAINYGGKPIFFKEDCMHRVFGDYTPYSCVATPCKGVQEGCSKSLAIVNDVLYYKSRSGICAYDGSLPVEISSNFGDKQYTDAVGGAIGNKYYISMKDVETGEHEMFVYDTVKRLWHKEDNTQATQFCNHQGNLYYIDRADNRIHVVKGTGNGVVAETDPIKWGAETGILGATTPDDKYVTRIDLRMSVAKGSKVSLHIEYDSMGEWERLMEIEGLTLNTFTVPVIPRRCDHFRLKFEGEGDAKIFSISKTLEESE